MSPAILPEEVTGAPILFRVLVRCQEIEGGDDLAAYRRNRIVGYDEDEIIAADVTGDGLTDLVALTPAGEMSLYANNFRANNAAPYSAHSPIGHGWNGYNRIIAADATGDGFTDLLGINPAGEMSLYTNNYRANKTTPYSAHRDDISHGWNSYNRII